ncbi:MAG: CRISPR-associated endonuclease Cas1 [Defluviicoccus sp.]
MSRLRSLAVRAGIASQVPRDETLPVYVQAHGATVGLDGERLAVTVPGSAPAFARLAEVSQVVLMGNVAMTTPCLQALMRRDIPVSWHSFGGWFVGHTIGLGHGNAFLRLAQYRAATDEGLALPVARSLIAAKIRACAVRLRRSAEAREVVHTAKRLLHEAERAEASPTLDVLRGVEGGAASLYWQTFAALIRPQRPDDAGVFRFRGRIFRPARDPVNALLSFSYALLARTCTVALTAVGFDAMIGFLHQPVHGRPALALDMMEPFRPLVAESAVIACINTGAVSGGDFERGDKVDGGGVRLSEGARRALIAAFEHRLDRQVTPEFLGYTVTFRRLIAVQGRLLAQFLQGKRDDFPIYTPR